MLRYKNAKNSPVTVQVGKGEAHPIKFTTSPYTRVPGYGRVAPYELEAFTGVLDKVSIAPRTEMKLLKPHIPLPAVLRKLLRTPTTLSR